MHVFFDACGRKGAQRRRALSADDDDQKQREQQHTQKDPLSLARLLAAIPWRWRKLRYTRRRGGACSQPTSIYIVGWKVNPKGRRGRSTLVGGQTGHTNVRAVYFGSGSGNFCMWISNE